MIFRQLTLQFILIGINALFASAEMAFVSLNETKLKKQAREGDPKSIQILTMLESPTGMLSAIQIGITLAGFLGSAFAADGFSDILVRFIVDTVGITTVSESMLDSISVVIITIILSYFTLIFGELVPKRLAMKQPEKIAGSMCSLITVISKALSPAVKFLSFSTDTVMKLLGADSEEKADVPAEEDILILLDEGSEQGTIDSESKEMIENIFELDNMSVSSVMTHRSNIIFININSTHEDILREIRNSSYSRYPVFEGNPENITGIMLTKEFLLNSSQMTPFELKQILHPPRFVPETMNARTLLRQMQRCKEHMAVVVDSFGGISGIITLEDLLEEIVGSIYDETDDTDDESFIMTDENIWTVSAGVPVKKINDKLNAAIASSNEYQAVSGYILENLSIIPDELTGIQVFTENAKITVTESEGLKIKTVSVELI